MTALAYSLKTAAVATGLSQRHLLNAINKGELAAHRSSLDKDGEPTGKWVIRAAALEAYLDTLPVG